MKNDRRGTADSSVRREKISISGRFAESIEDRLKAAGDGEANAGGKRHDDLSPTEKLMMAVDPKT